MPIVLFFAICVIIQIHNADAIAFIKKKPELTVIANRTEVITTKTQIQLLQDDLITWQNNLSKYTGEIPPLENLVNQAQTAQKSAKANHDNNPSETTHLKLVDADAKLATAKLNLSDKEKQKQEAADKVRSLNNQIKELSKQLLTNERTQDQKRRSISVNTVGILLSNTCVTMLKNNFHTTCPTYAELKALNLDTSKKESGLFSFYDGYYHRNDPLYKNDDQLYNLKDYNIFIDPSQAFHGKIKTITIQPNFNDYLLSIDMKKENNTRIIHQDRYVDACTDATINADTWIKTVADTVHYLRGGCVGTLLNSVYNVTDSTISHDIGTSSKYKQAQWMKEAKEKYKTSHIGNDTSVNPSVITDEDKR
mgnify:CR=1 FL=1